MSRSRNAPALVLAISLAACSDTGETGPSHSPGLQPFDHSRLGSPTHGGFEKSSVYVEGEAGVRLAVDLYLPKGGPGERYPTVLQYTPYQRATIDPESGELSDLAGSGIAERFTSHGYALAVADMRGTGASSGWLMDFMPEIWRDGKRLVDWIAAQPFSDGNVGMMGGSYLGWSQTATASQRPEALRCIVPAVIPLEGYTGEIYPGGIFLQGFLDRWSGFMYPLQRNHFDRENGFLPAAPVLDEDGDGELADEIPLDRDGSGTFLDDRFPPAYADGEKRSHVYYRHTAEHKQNHDYAAWAREMLFIDAPSPLGYTAYEIGPNAHLDGILESPLPIYHLGGWFDGFARGTFELYATLEGHMPQKLAMFPAYHGLLGGPFWQHLGEDLEAVRDLFLDEHLRFFDRYLKGTDNGLDREPPLLIYVMGGEGWRFESEWPLVREERRKLHFASGGTLADEIGGSGADRYPADLTHDSSYGSNRGNRWLGIAGSAPDALPWRTDLSGKTLNYETGPLAEPIEVTGHPLVHLAVSSSEADGDLFVYLEDVHPDGRSLLVTEAQLRANFAALLDNDEIVFSGDRGIEVLPELPWHGYERAQYVERPFADGRIVVMTIDFLPTSWVFRAGHRIRVSIAASDYPTFRLHPQVSPANDPRAAGNRVPTITVHRGGDHDSWIDLPVIPGELEKGATSGG